MILSAPIAGLGLLLMPSAGKVVAGHPALTQPNTAIEGEGQPPAPVVGATLPPAETAPAESSAATATAPADTGPAASTTAPASTPTTTPAPAPTCRVCGPVYATRDPLEGMNRVFYAINQPIDRFVLRPPAMLYKLVVPKVARAGIHNGLANIYSPVVFVNDVLQLKPKRAAQTLARFLINSTLGLGGLFDVAKRKPFRIAGHANSFTNSLAALGMTPGPYLYLPVVGPTTFRDMIGAAGDAAAQPLLIDRTYSKRVITVGVRRPRKVTLFSSVLEFSPVGIALAITSTLDRRAEADGELRALRHGAVDPYATLREAYLQNRAAEDALVHHKGTTPPPVSSFDDPLADPAAQAGSAPAAPPASAPAR